MKAILIKTDGVTKVIEIKGTLAELQEAVGGYIEAIRLKDHVAYINEEGKLQGLPSNAMGTLVAWQHGGISLRDQIVGDMIILGPTDENGKDTDVQESFQQELFSSISVKL